MQVLLYGESGVEVCVCVFLSLMLWAELEV